jgi:hypothetical protein
MNWTKGIRTFAAAITFAGAASIADAAPAVDLDRPCTCGEFLGGMEDLGCGGDFPCPVATNCYVDEAQHVHAFGYCQEEFNGHCPLPVFFPDDC